MKNTLSNLNYLLIIFNVLSVKIKIPVAKQHFYLQGITRVPGWLS